MLPAHLVLLSVVSSIGHVKFCNCICSPLAFCQVWILGMCLRYWFLIDVIICSVYPPANQQTFEIVFAFIYTNGSCKTMLVYSQNVTFLNREASTITGSGCRLKQ